MHTAQNVDGELTLVGIPVARTDTDEKLKDYVKKKKPAYSVQIGLSDEETRRVRDTVEIVCSTESSQLTAGDRDELLRPHYRGAMGHTYAIGIEAATGGRGGIETNSSIARGPPSSQENAPQ